MEVQMEVQITNNLFRAVCCVVLISGSGAVNGLALNTVAAQCEITGSSGMRVPSNNRSIANPIKAEVSPIEVRSKRSENDRRWDELFGSTTDEEFARLRRILQDEGGEEDTPLDLIIK